MALFYTAIFGQFKPYRLDAPNNLILEGQYQILFTFIAVLVVKQNAIPEIPYHEDVLDSALLICNSAMFISIMLSAWKNYNAAVNSSSPTVIKLLDIKSSIEKFSLDTGRDRLLCQSMLDNCSDEAIFKLLTLVTENIIRKKRVSSMKYTYYTPASYQKEKQLRFQLPDAIEKEPDRPVMYRDVEGGTTYLRIPQQRVDSFSFLNTFHGRIVEIPSEVFKLSYHMESLGFVGKGRQHNRETTENVNADDRRSSWGSVSTPDHIPIPQSILRGDDPIFSLSYSDENPSSESYDSNNADLSKYQQYIVDSSVELVGSSNTTIATRLLKNSQLRRTIDSKISILDSDDDVM